MGFCFDEISWTAENVEDERFSHHEKAQWASRERGGWEFFLLCGNVQRVGGEIGESAVQPRTWRMSIFSLSERSKGRPVGEKLKDKISWTADNLEDERFSLGANAQWPAKKLKAENVEDERFSLHENAQRAG